MKKQANLRLNLFSLFILFSLLACKKSETAPTPQPQTMYFPPNGSAAWEGTTAASLGWNTAEIDNLYTYLASKNTKAFIVLKKGRIVLEKYFGSFTADSNWYWASAGKTATAFLVGIAQQEGLLSLDHATSNYLGTGWTSLPANKEGAITIRHQLTMTSGLSDSGDDDCTLPSCLTYQADAGTRWAYHNAPYTLLDKVIEAATGTTFNNYFQQKIRNRIGMNGLWLRNGYNNVYYSTPRSAARFGLLLLNRGRWDGIDLLVDPTYFNSMVGTSQQLNLSYGYLTWLNGKSSHMVPVLRNVFTGSMVPSAPADLYAALGKNDQKIYVVPSQDLVVVRMGESAGNVQLAVSSFDSELWTKLATVIR
jgi:CubicO group peptidase (beta-lactamase class C family)